jgi:hypothetical protein
MFYMAFVCGINLLVECQHCMQLLKKVKVLIKAVFCKIWPYVAHYMFLCVLVINDGDVESHS